LDEADMKPYFTDKLPIEHGESPEGGKSKELDDPSSILERTLADIAAVEQSVAESLGLKAHSPEANRAADEALAYIAKETIANKHSTLAQRLDVMEDVAYKTLEEHGAPIQDTPAGILGVTGHEEALRELIEHFESTQFETLDGASASTIFGSAVGELADIEGDAVEYAATGQGSTVDINNGWNQLHDAPVNLKDVEDSPVAVESMDYDPFARRSVERKKTVEEQYFDTLIEGAGRIIDRSDAVQYSTKFLTAELGLSEELATEVFLGCSAKTLEASQAAPDEVDGSRVNAYRLKEEMLKIVHAVNEIGLDGVKKLRGECGIVNFGELSSTQLSRMLKFVDKDPEMMKQIKEKEVCVVIRDATNDWNGAFSGTYNKFEPENGLMLAFEVSESTRTQKQLDALATVLRDREVEPSVLVIAGHGSPGSVELGDSNILARSDMRITSDYPSVDESGIAKIIHSMRPDRDGNSSIIYNSCSGGGTIDGTKSEGLDASSSTLGPIESTADVRERLLELGNRPTPDNLLVHTANIAHAQRPETTFQVLGVDTNANMIKDASGNFVAGHDYALTRVVAASGRDGGTYRTYEKSVSIPMYQA
jgi:hypothetical protein